jgi:soluble lytic murein transglycosylase-like protein
MAGNSTTDESDFPVKVPGQDPLRRNHLAYGLAGLIGAVGIFVLVGSSAWFGWISPRIEAVESARFEAIDRYLDTESDLAAMEHELSRLRSIMAYSEAYRIPADLAGAIHRAAVVEDVEPDLAFRLVQTESGFRQRATSPLGAIGYTQILPSTAAWLEPGIKEGRLYDRDTNLRLGFRYMRQLLDRYDSDPRLALLAYNRGPGVVRARLARGEDPGNGFAERVLGAAE